MAFRAGVRALRPSSKALEALAMAAVGAVGVGVLASAHTSEGVAVSTAQEARYGPSTGRMDTNNSTADGNGAADVARRLVLGEVVVLDGLLSSKELEGARGDVDRLMRAGSFGANANEDQAVRSDVVCWVTGKEEGVGPALRHVVHLLRGLAHELQSTHEFRATKLVVQEAAQLACYDGQGAHYSAHRDADTDTFWDMGLMGWLSSRVYRERAVTAILYLNDPHWDQRKGGCLRCYANEEEGGNQGGARGHRDYDPRGGRLVLFDSKRVLHEVLPSSGRRVALTVWMGDQAGRAASWLS